VAAVSEEARGLDVERFWLLTTTAADFFERLGFRRTDRGSAPPDIASGAQFAGLCPSSVICLRCDLVRPAAPTDIKTGATTP